MAGGTAVSDGPPTQSSFVTAIFAFNLIIGVGALSLPFSMNSVGILLGSILILFVGALGYMSATFVMEAIANCSAILRLEPVEAPANGRDGLAVQALLESEVSVEGLDDKELFRFRHLELSKMSDLLFPNWGRVCFYIIISVYLYGDLAIYGAAVPLTLAEFFHYNYILFLAIFSGCMIPLVFLNFQKTKWLQIATLATRNVALFSMTVLTLRYIGQGKGSSDVRFFRPQGIATAFGNIVYAFMCHHSLPSILSPMQNKGSAKKTLAITFLLVACIYLVFPISAVFAFSNVSETDCGSEPGPACRLQKLYTQNFSSFDQQWLAGFLSLFPVFTLTSNFPLISITLRNTLLTLFKTLGILEHNPSMQRIVCSVLSPVPPLLLVCGVRDISALVGFTGSYAGMFIMFVVPASLVLQSRKKLAARLGRPVPMHELSSPFQNINWVYLIFVWSAISLVIITASNIMTWI